MRTSVRWAALAVVLGQFSCSGSDASPQTDTQSVAPYPGGGAQTSPASPTPAETATPSTPSTNTPLPSSTPPSEGQPNPVLAPPPADMPGGTADMPTTNPTDGTPPPPPATGALVPASSLPPIGNPGQPQPAGAVGNLKVLNWAGFKAAISYTFDDTNQTQIDRYAQLQALQVPLTFYLWTNKPQLASPIWSQALRDGHELGNHTANHMDTGGMNLAGDTDTGEATIERMFGITVYTMAAPYGAADYVNIARTRYLINRGTSDQLISATGNTDPFNLPCFIPPMGATTAMLNAKVDAIRNAGDWETMLVHGFLNNGQAVNGDFQPVDINQFTAGVTYTKSLGDVWIDRVMTIGAYWRAQKTFSGVTPTPANGAMTWSWTLPDHFPPGQFLRVTVSGGTLHQGDATVPWNDHGYYELALDRGSVTLSP